MGGAQLASRDQVETAWENGLDFGDNRIAWIDDAEFVSVPDVIGEPGNHSGGRRSKTSELVFSPSLLTNVSAVICFMEGLPASDHTRFSINSHTGEMIAG